MYYLENTGRAYGLLRLFTAYDKNEYLRQEGRIVWSELKIKFPFPYTWFFFKHENYITDAFIFQK